MKILVGFFVVVGVGVFGLWWWRGRTPADHGKFVSSAWLDDHVRGRRE